MEMHNAQTRLKRLLGFLSLDHDNFALLCEAADLSLQLGDIVGATELVDRAHALQPQDPVTRYRKAVILLHDRQPDQSLVITQALLDEGHDAAPVRFEHARGLAMSGRFEEAEPLLAALLPEAASFRELPQLYIRTLHYLGRLDEAIEFAQSYLREHAEDGVAQGMLSLLHLDHDDFAQAAQWSRQALERVPNNMDALIAAGSAALAYEKEGEAKTYFERAIAINGNSGRVWLGMGSANMLGMDLPAARAAFEKAVALMPTHLGSYNALAWVQILQRDYAGAKKTLHASLEQDRTFGETHGGLAVIAAIEGEWDTAQRLAETAVRLQPDSFSGRFAQSLVTAHRGRPEEAQAMVETAFRHFKVPGGGNLQDAVQRFGGRAQKNSNKRR